MLIRLSASVVVTMKFNVPGTEAASWSSANPTFTAGFASDIAAALGIDASRVQIVSASAQSVLLTNEAPLPYTYCA